MQADRRPNIILFFVDDMGWMDSSTYGSDFYETPNLDRLASEGMRFTQAYAQPLCSPSRAALMTGRYPARVRMHQAITGQSQVDPKVPARPRAKDAVIWPESRSHLPLGETTVAETLKGAGYQTWFLGKWHLGSAPRYWPDKQGFDQITCVGGAGPRGGYFGPNQIPGLRPPSKDGEYICERLTEDAIELIRDRGERPFFLLLSHFNVHAPYQARTEDVERFDTKRRRTDHSGNPVMAAMLWAMDQSLGKILGTLDEQGIAEDTWVLFVSDNGGIHWKNMKGDYAKRYPIPVTSNAPLRGGKACFYEGGVRVPFIVRHPGTVPANKECDTPVHLIDLYPTIYEITGVEHDLQELDGLSIVPLLTGTGKFPSRHLFCHFPRRVTLANTVGGSFIRDDRYKLIRLWFDGPEHAHRYELYDLSKDVSESMDLSSQMPERVQSMARHLDEWLHETEALLPRLYSVKSSRESR